jgi:hypothetical protein
LVCAKLTDLSAKVVILAVFSFQEASKTVHARKR